MIKGKYNAIEVIKQNDYKIIQRCQKQDGSIYVIKSFNLQEKKLIQNQIQTYQILKQPHLYGFPEIKEAFEDGGRIHIVLEELGANIEKLRYRCGGRLTLKTVLVIGLQILQRIQYLHQNGLIHGDIKPNNFVVGKGKLKHKIYLTDFQLCSSYLKNGKHIVQEAKDKFSGSFLFSSRNSNSKSNLSRKDDLQSWAYSLVYLCKGELPWAKIQSKNMVSANQEFLSLKNNCRDELLSGMPPTFSQIFAYIDQLKFSTTPQYDKIKGLLTKLMKTNGYQLDYKYDWEYL